MRILTTLALGWLLATAALAQEPSPLQQKLEAALDSDIRTPEEKARDAERKPIEVLQFMRLRDDMKVIELLPFGGWFTKILAQVLYDNGKMYTAQPELGFYSDSLEPTLALPGMERVGKIDWNGGETEGGNLWVGSGKWDVEPVDLVVTFRNYHNFEYAERMAINKSAFDVLKSGGYYGVVDHTRRHMEPDSRANGRRVDPVLAIKEIQDSGFILEDYTDVLRSPVDELTLEVGQPEVTGQTDRFVLLFRKP